MNFELPLSLEHVALTKIACTLWNREDIRKSVACFDLFSPDLNDCQRKEQWKEIVDIVMEEMLKFHLPKLLIRKLLSCVDAVGRQILKWLEYHKTFLSGGNAPKHLKKLCWTPHGTVDLKKTAEVILNDGDILCISTRYQIACIYCLEDDIRKLWNEMNYDCRKSFFWNYDELDCNEYQKDIVRFWSLAMRSGWMKVDENYTLNYDVAYCGNKEPIEFFLRKLTPMKKVETIVNVARMILDKLKYKDISLFNSATLLYENYADVLCSLLSHMNQTQQIELFKSHCFVILKCFLVFPWQSFFMETLKRMWSFLDHYEYYKLLDLILNKVKNNYKDFNYQKLFDEAWTQGPGALKDYDSMEFVTLLFKLLETKDEIEIKKDKFKFIYKDVTPTEKRNSIYCGLGIWVRLIRNEEWDFLEYFLQECISSKMELKHLKDVIRVHNKRLKLEKNLLNRFSQLLDNLIQKDNKKRSLEEGDNSVPKRFLNNELHAV